MIRRVGAATYWTTSIAIGLFSLGSVVAAIIVSFASAMPHLAHYVPSFSIPLLLHIIPGPVALMLAPFQLWQGLRTNHPRMHRWTGYAYLVSIVVAGLASLAMLPAFKGSLWAASGFFILAFLWIGFTVRGVVLARQKRFTEHRVWMLRSVALTFAAVTLRLMSVPMIISGMTLLETYNITAWASWILPLVAIETWRVRRRNYAVA